MTTLAFHTNAFAWAGVSDICAVARFAREAGFDALEVGPGFPLDAAVFEQALQIVAINNFSYARNFIDDRPEVAAREREELYARMRFAAALGVRKFVFSTGISKRLSVPESGGMDPLASLAPVVDFLHAALDLAARLDLVMLLENCPMYRNIAVSPVTWQAVFAAVPDARLGLCYDPSHFVWQSIDVYAPIAEFAARIQHVHLKDTAVDRAVLSRTGILHNVAKERGFFPNQWWRHTILGDGEIDWSRFKGELDHIGYDQGLSFEMEDVQYEGKPEKVKQGLAIQRAYLRKNWSI